MRVERFGESLMNPWIAYALGVATLPAGWCALYFIDWAHAEIRHKWIDTVEWRSGREYRRWEWGLEGRAVALTFKRWPHRGIVFTVRPWRPIVPARQPSMADDIKPIERPDG